MDAGEVDESLSSEDAIAAYIELSCRMPLIAPPGSVFSYSNVGYELAAEIVRRVSGESLEGFVQRQMFDPLGMRDAFLVVSEAARKRLALRYSERDGPVLGRYGGVFERSGNQRTPWGGWGAYSTARDLLTYGQTFLQGGTYGDARILSPAGVRQMTTAQTGELPMLFGDEPWARASWGYGWHIHGSGKGRCGPSLFSPSTFEHVGAGGSLLWVDPENEVVGVCLSLLRQGSMGWYPAWRGDLLINAIMAALDD
jgi:CubicO group peptidase (beta-lactamase class C family)